MKTQGKKDMYAIINEMILQKLSEGKAPWRQSWNSFGAPRNYATNKCYRGINTMILAQQDVEYPLYLTFLQVKELGGRLKKGSKSIDVIYWKTLEYEQEESIKRIPFLKYYNVFNISCLEGVDFKLPQQQQHDRLSDCENLLQAMPSPPSILFKGDQPCYNRNTDVVTIPKLENFNSPEEFYATLFHELSHATGHEKRLNRETLVKPTTFGSEAYCREELVAEIATCFLCAETGIGTQTLDNSASYIQWWLQRLKTLLKSDEKLFVRSSALAQRAEDYILARSPD